MRDSLGGNEVKIGVAAVLLITSIVLLFVPVADGADELRVMFFLLTAIVVFDLVRSVQEDKRVTDIQQALDPSPPPSHILEREDAEAM
jgi:hypothetical protein